MVKTACAHQRHSRRARVEESRTIHVKVSLSNSQKDRNKRFAEFEKTPKKREFDFAIARIDRI